MEDANYSNFSKYHLGQLVCRRLDGNVPKELATVLRIEFLIGGTVIYHLTWQDGGGGTAFEQELLAAEEREIVSG